MLTDQQLAAGLQQIIQTLDRVLQARHRAQHAHTDDGVEDGGVRVRGRKHARFRECGHEAGFLRAGRDDAVLRAQAGRRGGRAEVRM